MDVVTLGAALSGSKKYTDQVTQSLMGGVHYRGSVNYYADLPNDAQEGDSYTVKYAGSSGTVADGTEYTWGVDSSTNTMTWISFSKDAYSKAETDLLLAAKQSLIDASNKLDGSLVGPLTDYVAAVTAAALDPTDTLLQALGKLEKAADDNKNNISNQQDTIADGGNGYAIINGIRLYVASSAPTGDTGEISTLYGVFVSDFTPIEPNTTYTLNIVSDISGKTEHLFALYDENKNFVDTDSHEATQATVYTFTTPANVAYIRFNGNMASVDEIMLNTGSTALSYEPYSSEVWHATPHYIHNTSTDTITTLPAVLYPNDTTATVGLKGNMEQQSGTTTVPSKSVTVSSLESGTNYALFPKEDFPNAVVGDTINIVVSDTSYSQKVMKIDASYVYIENRTV